MNKLALSFLLAAFTVGSLAAACNVPLSLAQQSVIPTPSVPEFSVNFVNASYTITKTNIYTGINETHLISNNSIVVTIKNQPYYYSNNSLTYHIYFNVRAKPHFLNADNWTEIYPLQNKTSSKANADDVFSYAWYISYASPPQSNSSYTTITFPVIPTQYFGETGYDIQRYYSKEEEQEGRDRTFLHSIPDGGQLDFQIEALAGHTAQMWVIQHALAPTFGGYSANAIAYDLSSGWSTAQIVTIGETASALPTPTPSPAATQTPTLSPSLSPEPTATVPEFSAWIIVVLAVVAALTALIAAKIKKQNIPLPTCKPKFHTND